MVQIVNGRRVKSGGRTKGTPNKKSAAFRAAQADAARRLSELIPVADLDALTLLQAIYRSPEFDLPLRIEAAKQAIRFERPALSSVDSKLSGEISTYVAVPVAERDSFDLATVAAELATENG